MSFHLNRLVLEGLVARHEARPENFYEVREVEMVRDLLHRFHDSLGDAPPASTPAASQASGQGVTPSQPLGVTV